jgi:hypothetical protein
MSWFSDDDAVFRSREGLESIIECMETHLPEALPVRYGEYEPPKFRFAETGRAHLLDTLVQEYLVRTGGLVWQPTRPALQVSLLVAPVVRVADCGWRCHRLTLSVTVSALDQPGWQYALEHFWRALARRVRAFYSDVRTLGGYVFSGRYLCATREAEQHPICAWFWAGIPRTAGHAVALGEPYLSLWTEFGSAAHHEDAIAFRSTADWRREEDAFLAVGPVPEALAVQSPAYKAQGLGPNCDRVYPKMWPFGAYTAQR